MSFTHALVHYVCVVFNVDTCFVLYAFVMLTLFGLIGFVGCTNVSTPLMCGVDTYCNNMVMWYWCMHLHSVSL